MTVRHSLIDSPLGDIRLVADAERLVGLYFSGGKTRSTVDDGESVGIDADSVLAHASTELAEYFAGARTTFDISFELRGNDFQLSVWRLIAAIPYGATRTYGALATELGSVGLAQAVGRAAGANPIGIVVGCHRVVGANGTLVGYAGGLSRKRFLLDLEEPSEVRESRLF